MICQACRDAAKQRDAHPDKDPITVELLVREGHAKCPGGTWCDCGHRGEWGDKAAVSAGSG